MLSLLLVLGMSVYLISCRPAPEIKIGLVAPFTGRDRALGYDAIYAARLAVREINAAGGLAGRRLSLAALDDAGDPELAKSIAAGLTVDPAVLAVIGHGLTDTTAVGRVIYDEADLPLIVLGAEPFAATDIEALPADFQAAYEDVTPFDEVAGPFSGPTYDAVYLLAEALAIAESRGELTREGVKSALEGLEYAGVTGEVFQP